MAFVSSAAAATFFLELKERMKLPVSAAAYTAAPYAEASEND